MGTIKDYRTMVEQPWGKMFYELIYKQLNISDERDVRLKDLSTVGDDRWIDNEDYFMLEIWKYDPTKLSDSDTIDLLSLNLSLLSEEDERVQGELESLMEGYRWQ